MVRGGGGMLLSSVLEDQPASVFCIFLAMVERGNAQLAGLTAVYTSGSKQEKRISKCSEQFLFKEVFFHRA